jgi:outer membrane receptor protein involved in Fe transport
MLRPLSPTPVLLLLAFASWGLPAAPASPDEVVTLTEFQVTSASLKDEYVASEAVSGTRTGAKILELPYNVQVLTSQFMEDFQIFDENNYRPLQYVPNYAPDNGGRLRGFSPQTLRDGFSRAGPSAIANTQQIEVIMGPQSTLYGHVSPGGLVNYVSKQPRRVAATRLTAAGGSYEFQRYELETTGPLVRDKLYYLLNASYIFNGSATQHYYSNVFLYNLACTYRLSANTSVALSWEAQTQAQNGGTAIPDLLVGSRQSGTNILNRTGGINNGPYLPLAGFSQFGPNQRIERSFDNLNVRFEHRFSSVWSGRLSFQHYDKAFTDRRWTSGLSYVPETRRLTAHEPAYQTQDIKTDALQGDLLGRLRTAELSHALLLAADFTRDKYVNEQWQLPTATRDALPNSVRFIDPFNPDWTPIDYALVNRKTSWTTRDLDYQGFSGSYRLYAFRERLIGLAGLRYEKVNSSVENPLSAVNHGDGTEEALGYSVGLNYKLLGDRLLAYANYSTSFDTSTTVDQGINQVQKATRGRGPEAGFKGALLAERIGYTVSAFRIVQENLPITNPLYNSTLAGSGTRQYLAQGEVLVRGAEVAVSARLTDSFTVLANAGYLDAKTTRAPGSPALVGDTLTGVPSKTASAAARYNFRQSWLNGVRVGASVTYTGSRLTDLGSASVLRASLPAVQNYSGFVSYEWRHGRVHHGVNLNMQNLFDKSYITAANKLGEGRNFRVTYRLSL